MSELPSLIQMLPLAAAADSDNRADGRRSLLCGIEHRDDPAAPVVSLALEGDTNGFGGDAAFDLDSPSGGVHRNRAVAVKLAKLDVDPFAPARAARWLFPPSQMDSPSIRKFCGLSPKH